MVITVRVCGNVHPLNVVTVHARVLWRHAVLYIYVRKYESGGMMWPFIFKTMLFIVSTQGRLNAHTSRCSQLTAM